MLSMMSHAAARAILAAVTLAVGGCATPSQPPRRNVAPLANAAGSAPATRPVKTAAMLTLDELSPRLALPASRPSTLPTTGPAPLDAIALYAEARAKVLANQRLAAVKLLEDAIRLDPTSFELRFALGEAYGGIGANNDKAIDAFLAAAAINPNHLGVHTELGRQYLAKGQLDPAIKHLRLALLTSDYRRDNGGAASAEFLLARALQRNGNDRAALDAYARLLVRLRRPSAMRANSELSFLASQPEALFIQVGDLYAKGGAYDDALRAYELAAARRPENFDYAAKVVRALIGANRRDAAATRAADVVRSFRASNDSLELLREAYRGAGGDAAVATRLRALHRQSPDDRPILYALVNVLNVTGQQAEADQLLLGAVERGRYAIDDVRRLFDAYASRDDVDAATLLLTNALAARPDSLRELVPLWSDLLLPSRRNQLRVGRLQALKVPANAEAAKQFWISRLAQVWNRDVLARTALEQSAKQDPPLPPAFRTLLNTYWSRGDWDEARKVEASDALIATVERSGNAPLAAELRGLLLLNRGRPKEAADEFARAQKLGEPTLDLLLAQATAARATGNTARFEQLLWKLISDYPTAEDPYESLLGHYIGGGAVPQAIKVLRAWLAADPESVKARIIEASIYLQGKQTALAEQSLLKMFERHSDDNELLLALRNLHGVTGKVERYIDLLEAERVRRPDNRAAVAMLVELYAEQKRTGEATRVLDDAQAAVAKDPDLLYYVAHLYTRIGQDGVTEETLAKVVKLDPNHAAASNDLGYSWADKGKNLDRAEQLIRTAVHAEPDNQSFLDSLGWVLYKRSKFAEAAEQLEAAIAPATLPDPVVLDHLGDTLYRLGRAGDAKGQWQRSQQRLAQLQAEGIADSPDRRQLRLELQKKLKQAEDGQPVSVAPVVEAPQQAKN
jgi:tetratricopeptide (TPR) repeat protein